MLELGPVSRSGFYRRKYEGHRKRGPFTVLPVERVTIRFVDFRGVALAIVAAGRWCPSAGNHYENRHDSKRADTSYTHSSDGLR
jgi:hypothetical protein